LIVYLPHTQRVPPFPYTTLFRSLGTHKQLHELKKTVMMTLYWLLLHQMDRPAILASRHASMKRFKNIKHQPALSFMNSLKILKIEKQILLKVLIRHTYSMKALIKSLKKSVKKQLK